jgi:choline-sulfatase
VPAQRRTGHPKRPPLTLLTPRLLVHCVVTPWLLSVTAIGALSGAEGARPNMIVITVDALRADHLGVYGYTRPTSPAIDAFAKGAVVVTDAISQAPYTKASVASLLTGLYPTTHKTYTTKPKVGQLMTTGVGKTALPYTDILGAELQTLPEALKAAGYETFALTSNPFLISEFGFAQGFDHFRFISEQGEFGSARYVLAEAMKVFDARSKRPFFLWVHLMEPHSPYTPPEPYRSMFPALTPPEPIDPSVIPAWIRIGGSRDLNLYKARYDGEIRTADEAIGKFFEELRRRRLWDRTAIILTADHGESFMEHGVLEHNTWLYDELVRVPLVIRIPGLPPRRVRTQVQLVDLFPTLAGIAGAKVPTGLHGRDRLADLQGRTNSKTYAYSEVVGSRFAIRTLEWKYISSLQGGRQLFDLRVDPREQNNLARQHPERVEQLERVLQHVVATAVMSGEAIRGQSSPVSPEVLKRLRSLGYLGH